MQKEQTTRTLQPWQAITGGISALVLTIGLARFAYTPLLPQMHAQAHLSDTSGGWLAAINYAGYMSGALLASWIDEAHLRHRLYSAGLWLSVLATMLMGMGEIPWLWALSRFLGGLCGAAGMLLGSGLLLNWLMRHGRPPELGTYFTGVGLGIIVSAVGAMAMSHAGLNWARQWQGFAFVGLLVFFAPAWAWRPPVPPAPMPITSSSSGDTAMAPSRRWMVLMWLSYFCAGWGFVINATFTVAIVERQPLLAGQGPLAWLLVGLAGAPSVFLWDRLARRLGGMPTLLSAFGLQAIGVVLPALSDGLAAALVGALMYGATTIGIVSLTLSLVGRRSPANPGKAMARLTLGYGLAQISAPALAGYLVQATGSYHGTLWLAGLVLVLGMVALLPLLRSAE